MRFDWPTMWTSLRSYAAYRWRRAPKEVLEAIIRSALVCDGGRPAPLALDQVFRAIDLTAIEALRDGADDYDERFASILAKAIVTPSSLGDELIHVSTWKEEAHGRALESAQDALAYWERFFGRAPMPVSRDILFTFADVIYDVQIVYVLETIQRLATDRFDSPSAALSAFRLSVAKELCSDSTPANRVKEWPEYKAADAERLKHAWN